MAGLMPDVSWPHVARYGNNTTVDAELIEGLPAPAIRLLFRFKEKKFGWVAAGRQRQVQFSGKRRVSY